MKNNIKLIFLTNHFSIFELSKSILRLLNTGSKHYLADFGRNSSNLALSFPKLYCQKSKEKVENNKYAYSYQRDDNILANNINSIHVSK